MKFTVSFFSSMLLIALLISGCVNREGSEVVTVDRTFSVYVPKNLFETNTLSPEAVLQYQNGFDHFYMIVLEEPFRKVNRALHNNPDSSVSFTQYVDYSATTFYEDLGLDEQPKLISDTVNDLHVSRCNIHTSSGEEQIHYTIQYIEGSGSFYQLIVWTKEGRSEATENKVNRIINSFCLVNSNKR